MKRKHIVLSILLALGAVLGAGLLWYHSSVEFVDLNPDEVGEIVVFSGNSGKTLHITEKEEINHLISNWNTIELKRDKLSIGYLGYRYKVTIYLANGEQADGWNNFIINSDDTVRKDPFFYQAVNSAIDDDYLSDLFDSMD